MGRGNGLAGVRWLVPCVLRPGWVVLHALGAVSVAMRQAVNTLVAARPVVRRFTGLSMLVTPSLLAVPLMPSTLLRSEWWMSHHFWPA